MLVGTYTSGSSTGIYVYRFNTKTGDADYVSEANAVNPSYLAISANERYVYSVGENSEKDAVVYAFSFDRPTGRLHLLNMQPINSSGPCYVATDRSGRFVTTANYSGGTVSVLPLATDGSLQPVEKVFCFEGVGPDVRRQEKPHLHSTVFSPDRKYLFAADLGSDKLHRFDVNATTPFLTTGTPEAYTLEPGSGPRHLTFHPNGKFAYLINELSGKVTVFHYDNGHLESVQYIVSDTSPSNSDKGSADIHVSPDGRFLYASNRANTNNIAIFSINQADGQLTTIGFQPTELHPRNFIITPDGKFLLAANRDSNSIQIFKINKKTGLLKEKITQKITTVDRPVCLKFIGSCLESVDYKF